MRARVLLSEKYLHSSTELELKNLQYLGVISNRKYNEVLTNRKKQSSNAVSDNRRSSYRLDSDSLNKNIFEGKITQDGKEKIRYYEQNTSKKNQL